MWSCRLRQLMRTSTNDAPPVRAWSTGNSSLRVTAESCKQGHRSLRHSSHGPWRASRTNRRPMAAFGGKSQMVKNADHVTVVVRDVEAARTFFALLGFKEE